jgi:hypothetical protein
MVVFGMAIASISRPYGLPVQSGAQKLSLKAWEAMSDFIKSRCWFFDEPYLVEDAQDLLLAPKPDYGAFMMGFDFHITSEGPRLIEINTNAGGFATAMSFAEPAKREQLAQTFVAGLRAEFATAMPHQILRRVAILDEGIAGQGLFLEMEHYAELLKADGLDAVLISPEDLSFAASDLTAGGKPIDLVYNRLVDFRLTDDKHRILREALLTKVVAATPHPGVYVRAADKRNFIRLKHPLVPQTHLFTDRPAKEWEQERKHWMFKPPTGAASKGVYRGDKLSRTKFATLPPDTIVQRLVEPMRTPEGLKFDIRVYTHDTHILGVVARQYAGQVMEMSTEHAGFKAVIIE